ncbi:MAG TPA: hypothetical protein VF733_04580, partial [Candidatus Saccharimonadales bacterium]
LDMITEMGKHFNLYNLRARGLHERADAAPSLATMSPLEALHLCYRHYHPTFQPIEWESLVKEVRSAERAIETTLSTHQKLAEFFKEPDPKRIADSEESDDFYQDLCDGITQSRIARSTLALKSYLQIERVMSQFERAEQLNTPGDALNVLALVAEQGFNSALPDPPKGPVTSKYQSVENLQWLGDRLHDRDQKLEPIEEEFDRLAEQFHTFMDTNKEITFEESMIVGVEAIRHAEATLLRQAEENLVNPKEFPFTLLDNTDETGQTFNQELAALRLLGNSPLLNKVRSEIAQTLTILSTERNRDYIKEAWRKVTNPDDWDKKVADARKTVTHIVNRNLDSIKEQSRPAMQLIAGTKRRPPKKSKNNQQAIAPLVEAEDIYNKLHKEANFSQQQTALIAAIASNTWEPIRQRMEKATDSYNQILDFAEAYGLQGAVINHDLSAVIAYSPKELLNRIQRMTQTKGKVILQSLSALQRARLDHVIAEMIPPDEQ